MEIREEVARREVLVKDLKVSAYEIPSESPESDGTLKWNSTTIVVVEVFAGDKSGTGYTYADASTGALIKNILIPAIRERDAMDIPGIWNAMIRCIRNQGRPGTASMAISAVDCALWDLKARLLDIPLSKLLGQSRDFIPVYGSGGFTSYSIEKLKTQFEKWIADGVESVKMKVGRDAEADVYRVGSAREVIGDKTALFVDANGAYSRKQALLMAKIFADYQVTWFEEPVSSDDLEGLRLIRDNAPPGMDITAGEYGYDLTYFNRMIRSGAVDVIMPDVTRCGGISGFLKTAAIGEANHIPVSAHCAPSLSVHPMCAVHHPMPAEYFYDHVRVESMLFDGFIKAKNGKLTPDLSRPGNGLKFKYEDAEAFKV